MSQEEVKSRINNLYCSFNCKCPKIDEDIFVIISETMKRTVDVADFSELKSIEDIDVFVECWLMGLLPMVTPSDDSGKCRTHYRQQCYIQVLSKLMTSQTE